MNAAVMVELALNWTHLPEQHRCQVFSQDSPRLPFSLCWMTSFFNWKKNNKCNRSRNVTLLFKTKMYFILYNVRDKFKFVLLLFLYSKRQTVMMQKRFILWRFFCFIRSLPANSVTDISIEADRCENNTDAVRSLEHVQVSITLSASQRGEVELSLTSPSGTRSVLLARRAADTSYEGLTDWIMMTTHCWGERPLGTWTLTVHTGATTGKFYWQ